MLIAGLSASQSMILATIAEPWLTNIKPINRVTHHHRERAVLYGAAQSFMPALQAFGGEGCQTEARAEV